MSILQAERPMAKRTDAPVRIDSHVLERARIVAAMKKMSLNEYLSKSLSPIIEKDLKEEIANLSGPESPPAAPPRRKGSK